MPYTMLGNSGLSPNVDANLNIMQREGDAVIPAAGGFYTVGGQTSAVVAAALAANVMLMSMRMAVGSARKAYLKKFRLVICPATVGVSGGVAGTIGLQRFTAQTPTGGTPRTPQENDEGATLSDITDIRDSNAALTGSAPTFGAVLGVTLVPVFTTGGSIEWIFEPEIPIRLNAGDGIALRTQVAMAATQTWMYSYTAHWSEK